MARQTHDNSNPAHTQTSFAAWCQKHVSITKMLHRLINRRRMEDIHALVQSHTTTATTLHSEKFPAATNPHDAEFESHHFQEHVTNPSSTTTSTSTKCTIPAEEMCATYSVTLLLLLPTTQLRMMSTIRRRHVRFRHYYHMTHSPKICHITVHQFHQRAKISTVAYQAKLQTRNIRSFLQHKYPHLGPDASAKNLLRPP